MFFHDSPPQNNCGYFILTYNKFIFWIDSSQKNWYLFSYLEQVDKEMNTLQEDLRKVDHWLFPLNFGTHWHLLDVNISNKMFKSYNSMKGKKKHDNEVRRWVSEWVIHWIFLPVTSLYSIILYILYLKYMNAIWIINSSSWYHD